MSKVITIEAAELAYDAHRHESNLARLGGRRKFQFCYQCGSQDGMQAVRRETLEEMPRTREGGEILATWHREPGNDEYLFHSCLSCNRDKVVPAGYISMTADEVLNWLDRDPMAPDYAKLAAEPEPVSQIEDSRESAGL